MKYRISNVDKFLLLSISKFIIYKNIVIVIVCVAVNMCPDTRLILG